VRRKERPLADEAVNRSSHRCDSLGNAVPASSRSDPFAPGGQWRQRRTHEHDGPPVQPAAQWEKAETYMEFQAFSRSGLIEQLEFEGFTSKEAEHGANAVGL
jgi:hypothetical protein